ncbi:MAG: hypothetical protein ACREM1_20850 [Longimicrobiales bacterium]
MFRHADSDAGAALGRLRKLFRRMIALALPVLSSCTVEDGVGPASTSAGPLFNAGLGAASVVSNVENSGAHFPEPSFPSFDELPAIRILPEPFRFFGEPDRPCRPGRDRPWPVGFGEGRGDARPDGPGWWDRERRRTIIMS